MVSKSTPPAKATVAKAAENTTVSESAKATAAKAETVNKESGPVEVQVTTPFYGVAEQKSHTAGDKITVDAARAADLRSRGFVK